MQILLNPSKWVALTESATGVNPQPILWEHAPFRRKPRWRRRLRLQALKSASSLMKETVPSGIVNASMSAQSVAVPVQEPSASVLMPLQALQTATSHLPKPSSPLSPREDTGTSPWHPPLTCLPTDRIDMLSDYKNNIDSLRTLNPEAFAKGLSCCQYEASIAESKTFGILPNPERCTVYKNQCLWQI